MTWLDLKTMAKLLVNFTMAKFIHSGFQKNILFSAWFRIIKTKAFGVYKKKKKCVVLKMLNVLNFNLITFSILNRINSSSKKKIICQPKPRLYSTLITPFLKSKCVNHKFVLFLVIFFLWRNIFAMFAISLVCQEAEVSPSWSHCSAGIVASVFFPSSQAKPLKQNNGSHAATLIAIFLSVFLRQE